MGGMRARPLIQKPLEEMSDEELRREASWRIYNATQEQHVTKKFPFLLEEGWDRLVGEIFVFLSQSGKTHIYEAAYRDAMREAGVSE